MKEETKPKFFSDRKPSWRPVTFTSESIDKIESGLITQLIRRVYPQPKGQTFLQDAALPLNWLCPDGPDPAQKWRCSYGLPGDLLWVRQVWARVEPYPQPLEEYGMPIPWRIEKSLHLLNYWRQRVIFSSDFPNKKPEECGRGSSDNVWRSPGVMPQWASRRTLEITEIRGRRIQEISPAMRTADVEISTDEIASNVWVWQVFFRKVDCDAILIRAKRNEEKTKAISNAK